ncbi:NUDIX hydrolase [Antarcticimicrobium luteum]|uniref:NUDIX hydrolase n=1 Tax=Antarcticimicrobium luteum TaxID=2547397 RepID=A0A4V6PMB0_9RHOB|nr:NUDIX hydrolase [Antarcticimicrobium luteum]TDK51950.1 NUDIX hydrolase [Antarcticimicrobium luteum]
MDAHKFPWLENVKLMLSRPKAVQLGALCFRQGKGGKLEVLLITSSRGRWILPKGWPISGLDSWETALQEAWEEAGVREGKPWRRPLTSYQTVKKHDSGLERDCTVWVYPVEVTQMRKDYPEADKRQRAWLSIDGACQRADDPGVCDVLKQFAQEMEAKA